MTGMLHKPSEADIHARLASMIFVPPKVDFERIMIHSGAENADRARYLVHTLLRRMIYRNRRDRDGRPACVPEFAENLMASIIRRQIGEDFYIPVREDLKAAGVIETYEHAKDGQSFFYWFGPTILDQTFYPYSPSNRWILHRVKAEPQFIPLSITCPIRKYVCEQMRRLTVDNATAEACFIVMDAPAKFVAQNSLRRLLYGPHHATHDDFGRLHNNFTNQNKSLRQVYRVDGEPLWEIDIPNSQPIFLGMACVYWVMNERNLKTFTNMDLKTLEGIRKSTSKSLPIRCGVNETGLSDLENYLACCSNGQFYETLGEAYYKAELDPRVRETFKERVFKSVIYATDTYWENKLVKIFRSTFPTLFDLVVQARSLDGAGASGILQRMEAQFIFERVVARLIRERPGIFVLTIHDAILVKASDAKYARHVMTEEFQRIGINVIPKLKKYVE